MARNSNNKFPGKLPGRKVNTSIACGDCQKGRLKELESVIDRMNRQRDPNDQIIVDGNMRLLLEHLERGEVHFMTKMTVNSAMMNKPLEVVTTIRTFLKGVEKLWIVHHTEKKPYSWKATYTSVEGAFSDFYIYSCDTLVLLS